MTAGPSEAFPPVIFTGKVASAMDEAWKAARSGALPAFGSILAESQTAGRGRRGSFWESPPGHVYAAMRLPADPPFSGTSASLAAALMLARALEAWALKAGALEGAASGEGALDFKAPALEIPALKISIKWPNDLIAFGGKAGGILLESRGGDLVAGIGLNLGQPPPVPDRAPGAPPPAALPGAMGPPERLWPEVAKICLKDYNDKFGQSGQDWPKALAALAEPRLYGLGRPALVVNPAAAPAPDLGESLGRLRGESRSQIQGEIRGRIAGLDPSGALKLETAEGTLAVWSGTLILVDPVLAGPESAG